MNINTIIKKLLVKITIMLLMFNIHHTHAWLKLDKSRYGTYYYEEITTVDQSDEKDISKYLEKYLKQTKANAETFYTCLKRIVTLSWFAEKDKYDVKMTPPNAFPYYWLQFFNHFFPSFTKDVITEKEAKEKLNDLLETEVQDRDSDWFTAANNFLLALAQAQKYEEPGGYTSKAYTFYTYFSSIYRPRKPLSEEDYFIIKDQIYKTIDDLLKQPSNIEHNKAYLFGLLIEFLRFNVDNPTNEWNLYRAKATEFFKAMQQVPVSHVEPTVSTSTSMQPVASKNNEPASFTMHDELEKLRNYGKISLEEEKKFESLYRRTVHQTLAEYIAYQRQHGQDSTLQGSIINELMHNENIIMTLSRNLLMEYMKILKETKFGQWYTKEYERSRNISSEIK